MYINKLKQVLPDDYEILSQVAKVLPANESPIGYPFTGFTINFNVSTRVHRDWFDLKLCIVLPVMDDNCEGGDICFVEPGIRLELKTGFLVLFRSRSITHFNMHYKGYRASIVFHSDMAGEDWVSRRNGWSESNYINTLRYKK